MARSTVNSLSSPGLKHAPIYIPSNDTYTFNDLSAVDLLVMNNE